MMNLITETHIAPSGEERVLLLPDWSTFDVSTVVEEAIMLFDQGRALADSIASLAHPAFHTVVLPWEAQHEKLVLVAGTLSHLKGVMSGDMPDVLDVADRVTELYAAYDNDISMHVGLYRAYVAVRDNTSHFASLSDDERRIVTETIRQFELSGVGLPPETLVTMKQLRERASALSVSYENNIQRYTDAWFCHVTDASEFDGIPASDRERMKQEAVSRQLTGWVITLQFPDVIAVLMYANHRPLRKHVADARRMIGSTPEWDNTQVSKDILVNAHAQARLLGFEHYAQFSLEPKMARGVGVLGVQSFLRAVHGRAFPKASEEYARLTAYAQDKLGISTLEAHDFLYAERILREEMYALDLEEVRAYIPFTKAMEAISSITQKTFGFSLLKRTDIPTWHPSVVFYELRDEAGALRGAFYADMYARKGKRSGAWMDTLVTSRRTPNGTLVPVAYLVCNAPVPGESGEAYLTHDELVTLFHEFGHTFHLVSAEPVHTDLSMNNVEWDTVELPSQWMENYAWVPDVLRSLSAHRDTGLSMSDEMIAKLLSSRHFHTGLSTVRQLRFSLYDLELYSTPPDDALDPTALWHSMGDLDVRPTHPNDKGVNNFRHIMSGGYSAGYFSYMWALALVAQAWEPFESDPMNREVGARFHREIIAPGASRPMEESFESFCGKLNPDALSRYLGLL
jgi:oligopeptidase A